MEESDERLMKAWGDGDPAAFDRLFARHRRTVFTWLFHHTGDRARAEDLFQEVFLRLVRSHRDYRHEGRFVAWLFTLVRNVTTDERRRGALRDAAGVNAETPLSERWSDPGVAVEARELGRGLLAALLALPPEQREVFLLRERAGLDYDEIARVTGAPAATLRSRMRYALERLRARLAPHFDPCPETSRDRV